MNGMSKAILLVAIIFIILIWTCFSILTVRADFWQRGTAVGGLLTVVMYICCLTATISSIYLNLKDDLSRYITTLLLILALIPTVGFFFLNITRVASPHEIKRDKRYPFDFLYNDYKGPDHEESE